MRIQSIVLHNWANLPDDIYEPGQITLITGGNGAGKTTLGDAVQTILTAARGGWFQYNPGQDESTQQSKTKKTRTLASYAMGCDDGPFGRTTLTDTYIGINFVPDEGEIGTKFFAMLAIRAHLVRVGEAHEAKIIRDPEMFILPGEQLCLDDLKNVSGTAWLDMERELKGSLIARYGKQNVEHFESKETYLCRLYALFLGKDKGHLLVSETKKMVKAIVKFMAYQPVKDLHRFVRDSVLEAPNNEDIIEQISSMMTNINDMASEAEAISVAIDAVKEGLTSSDTFISYWLQRHEDKAVCELIEKQRVQDELNGYIEEERECQETLVKTEQLIKRLKAEIKANRDSEVTLTAKCQGIPSYRDKEALNDKRKVIEDSLHAFMLQMLQSRDKAKKLKHTVLEILSKVDNTSGSDGVILLVPFRKKFVELSDSLSAIKEQQSFLSGQKPSNQEIEELVEIYTPIEICLEELESILQAKDGEYSILDEIREQSYKAKSALDQARIQRNELHAQIERLKSSSRVSYPDYTQQALKELMREMPNCNARVVGDHIEIVDVAWQNAIEGYMKGARYSIVVDPHYEAQAIKLVRRLNSSARVVQGEKAKRDADRSQIPSRSICELMEIDDLLVRSFVHATYGSVVQVEDAEELRKTRRGLTASGMGSGSYAMFKAYTDDSDLVCGAAARKRRLFALEKRHDLVSEDIDAYSDKHNDMKNLAACLDSIKALNCIEILDLGDQKLVEHEQVLHAIDALDLTEIEEIEEELERVKELGEDLQNQSNDAYGVVESTKARLYGKNKDKESIQTGSLCKLICEKRDQLKEKSAVADERIINYVDWRQQVEDIDQGSIIDIIQSRVSSLEETQIKEIFDRSQNTALNARFTQVSKKLGDYNMVAVQNMSIYDPFDAIIGQNIELEVYFTEVIGIRNEFARLQGQLKNNILADKLETIQRAQKKFDETFTGQLVQQILSSINDSKRTLKSINSELEFHVFDDETYEFIWESQKEFADYLRCFKEIKDIPESNLSTQSELFTPENLSAKSLEIIDSLKRLLLQRDDIKAKNELIRIADYRNYHAYDILKKPKNKPSIRLSTYGTGSGGQLETPFYVIMAAAYQSALGFSSGSSHLRMVMIDESFGKLDENRSAQILKYLSSKLGLQILFILPGIKSGGFANKITNQIVISKTDDPNPPENSQLKKRVIVDQQVLETENVFKLSETYRETIKQQTVMKFMELVEEAETSE